LNFPRSAQTSQGPGAAGHNLGLGFDLVHRLTSELSTRPHPMTQMLRRLAFILLGRRQNLHRTASLFDRRNGGFGSAVNLDGQFGFEFATT
jgi:hypothetical protein